MVINNQLHQGGITDYVISFSGLKRQNTGHLKFILQELKGVHQFCI